MSQAERQSAHRMQLENKVIGSQISQSKTGQWMAFIITLVALGITCYLALTGHETTAGFLASTTIIGLASVFIYGKKEQKRDLEAKNNLE